MSAAKKGVAGPPLYDFQKEGLARVAKAFRSGARSVLLVSPTGSGKTQMFAALAAETEARRKGVVVLTHRHELADQASERLDEFYVPHGLIVAGKTKRASAGARVQVATVQTLARRDLPQADLVICDEAHLSTADTWTAILEKYPRARILGVTATPWRLSGRPLASTYDAAVVVATPAELREGGYLCGYTGFSYRHPDMAKVKKSGGDYARGESAKAMGSSLIVDNVVEEWSKHARELSTVVFAVTVEHSRDLARKFRAVGVKAEHLDGKTSRADRADILARVASGETRVLCNVDVAVEGINIRRLKCCVLARPTASLARAIQMQGRVRREWNGVEARIHDHAFVIKSHGLPDDERDYTLEAGERVPAALLICSVCGACFRGVACPSCNARRPRERGERTLRTVTEAERWEFRSDVTQVNEARRVEAIRRYRKGESTAAIGHALSVSRATVCDWLRKVGVLKSPSEARGVKTSWVAEWRRRYEAGEDGVSIAADYRVAPSTVLDRLRDAGVRMRTLSELRGVRPGWPDEWARCYRNGEPSSSIARRYGVAGGTVRRNLRDLGVEMRSGSTARGINQQWTEEWIASYRSGMAADVIARKYKVSGTTVMRTLRRLGIQPRPPGRRKRGGL